MSEATEKEINEVSQAAREAKLQELEILQQSLEEKKKLAEDYYNQLLRLKAEFDNFRRRTEREMAAHLNWGKEEMILKQVNLLDVLDRATESAKTSDNMESIRKGLELIHQQFVKMLTDEGVKEFGTEGEEFDPAEHEAVEQVESDKPENTIAEVVQKGYSFNSRIIRPARVKVAKNKKNN